jgi:Na+/melibiose symporter-like transporter
MDEFDSRRARRGRDTQRRGVSGLGLLLVVVGAFVLLATFSGGPAVVLRLWPLLLVAVGLFGLLRTADWVRELDLWSGPEATRASDRPRRLFSLLLIVLGAVCLLFTLNLVDSRVIGPGLLIGIGLLLVWRRAR